MQNPHIFRCIAALVLFMSGVSTSLAEDKIENYINKADQLLQQIDQISRRDNLDELLRARDEVKQSISFYEGYVRKFEMHLVSKTVKNDKQHKNKIATITERREALIKQQRSLSEKLNKMKSSHPDYEITRYDYINVSQQIEAETRKAQEAFDQYELGAKEAAEEKKRIEKFADKHLPKLRDKLAELDQKIAILSGDVEAAKNGDVDGKKYSFSYRGIWSISCNVTILGVRGETTYKGYLILHANQNQLSGEMVANKAEKEFQGRLEIESIRGKSMSARISGIFHPYDRSSTMTATFANREINSMLGGKLIGHIHPTKAQVATYGKGTIVNNRGLPGTSCQGYWYLDKQIREAVIK